MKNIYKFLREKTAKITVDENVVTVEREDGQTATFEANKDNFFIAFNVGMLGGEIERNKQGALVVVGTHPAAFVNGGMYKINAVEYYSDAKGKAEITYEDTFFELFLDL